MFESIQNGLSGALRTLSGKGKLTESNMREGMELVRQALLEADVSYQVVQDFVGQVSEEAVGERVLKSLDPSQQLVGVVYRHLTNLMGPVDHSMHLHPGVNIVMMCGLQGSGKTTTCGKLAGMLKSRGKQPLLVAADLQRPAAIDQLHVIGEQLEVPVYSERGAQDPVAVCHSAVKKAKELGRDVVILDTAGRLHIDQELMQQLELIDRRVSPDQVYLVVDGMTGQDAVNSAKAFNDALELDGVILTKLDGDARGGAVLSVKQVTGVPIKFIGTGEHLNELQEFHPDRMAQRILGMGDILTLVEEAQSKFDQEEMAKLEEENLRGELTFEMFRKQLQMTRRLGPLGKVMGMIPGMGKIKEMMGDADADADMPRLMGIIDSMTLDERRSRNPGRLIDQSRRRRIATGAGVEPHEVNELVKQFDGMRDIMKRMAGQNMRDKLKTVQQLQQSLTSNPAGMLSKPKVGTGKRLTSQEKARMRRDREKEMRRIKRERKS